MAGEKGEGTILKSYIIAWSGCGAVGGIIGNGDGLAAGREDPNTKAGNVRTDIAFGQRGIGDALFANAQNKQTIRRLVAPLRRLGIPAAAIVASSSRKFRDSALIAGPPETMDASMTSNSKDLTAGCKTPCRFAILGTL